MMRLYSYAMGTDYLTDSLHSSGSVTDNKSPDPSSPTFNGNARNSPTIRGSKSSASPSTAGGGISSFRRASKPGADQAGTVLNKRMSVADANTLSPKSPGLPAASGGGDASARRALDRIPKPDFAGYLRKKGERYNSWKLRYCVLSGPHLYYLKSENVGSLPSIALWLLPVSESLPRSVVLTIVFL